jgi:predicted dehydrogenase
MGRKHAELIDTADSCTLAGICDIDRARRVVADDFGVPFYQNTNELLENADLDGAVIAVPSSEHASVVEVCARKSVHLLIEKPIAGTMDEAARIVDAADRCGVEMLVGHHRRHNPLVLKAKSLIQEGSIGRLVGVSVLWALYKPEDYFQVDWRCRRPGGGPLMINLIHEIDSLRFLCGDIRQVYSQCSSAARQLEVEDTLSITLTFGNGALGSIWASDSVPAPWSYEATTGENPYYFHADENCYVFFGSLGSLTFPRMQLWRYAGTENMGWQFPLEKTDQQVEKSDPLRRQLDHFCRVVAGAEKPVVDVRDGARSLAAALAVLDSMRRNAPVWLSPPL